MNGLPADANYAASATRFSLGISHPAGRARPSLYAGFDWFDADGDHHTSRVFKSTDDGASWAAAAGTGVDGTDNVADYCGDAVLLRQRGRGRPDQPERRLRRRVVTTTRIGSGGIFRSTDGGQTWKNLGYDLHPDFHALAFDPTNTAACADRQRRRRLVSARPRRPAERRRPAQRGRLAEPQRHGRPDHRRVMHRTGLAITQFTSIATVPDRPGPVLGRHAGQRHAAQVGSPTTAGSTSRSGDGGQVLVDPTPNTDSRPALRLRHLLRHLAVPVRPDGGDTFFGNESITRGINLTTGPSSTSRG